MKTSEKQVLAYRGILEQLKYGDEIWNFHLSVKAIIMHMQS